MYNHMPGPSRSSLLFSSLPLQSFLNSSLCLIEMSFGYSITDFVLLVQLAHNTFRNCQNAGEEYAEIACEVKCLHSVLKTLRQEARRPDSRVLDENTSVASQLLVIVDGCKNILDKLDHIIARYSGLKTGSEASPSKKLWQRLRFGSKMEELGAIREKIITYTSTISILLDTMQLHATGRVEFKMEGGFADMTSQFEQMRREIFEMASHARAEESKGANMSSLSLSTYAGDDKVVWRDFRRELLKKGFRGQSLEKYKYSLQAYMLKLDQSGLLENSHASSPWPPEQAIKTSVTPWWEKRRYLETINSIVDVQLTEHLEPPMAPSSSSEMPTPSANKRADIYGSDVVEDNTDLEIPGDLVDKQKPNIVKDLEPDTILSATRSSTTGVTEFQTMVLSVQSKKFERSRVGKIEMPKV